MGYGLSAAEGDAGVRYKVAFGRIIGRAHIAAQTPCQDYASGFSNANMGCIALADGAGSRPKSHIGAEAVVRATLRLLRARFDAIYSMCEDAPEVAQGHIHAKLLTALHRTTKKHDCNIGDLASTLLFVARKGKKFMAGHIGDGLIAQIDPTGAPQTLSQPNNGEYANTTYFVTDSDAVRHLRLFHGELDQNVSGYAIMSDGCAESLHEKKTGKPATAVRKLLTWNQTLSRSMVNAILRANMEQAFSKKSADDCSLGLLSIILVNDNS